MNARERERGQLNDAERRRNTQRERALGRKDPVARASTLVAHLERASVLHSQAPKTRRNADLPRLRGRWPTVLPSLRMTGMRRGAAWAALALCVHAAVLVGRASAFYIPALLPNDYVNDDAVELWYNKVYSEKTQLPFEYVTLPVCRPPEGERVVRENLGEILRGDRFIKSPYKVSVEGGA